MKYCKNCEKVVQEGRYYGIGTLILVLVTCGWWLLAMILYRPVCPICKADNFDYSRKI